MKKLICGVILLATTISVLAQGGGMRMMSGGGGGNPIMLLQREDVQEDLGLNDDQKGKLTDIQSGMRDRFMKIFTESGVSFEEMRTPEGRKKMEPMMAKVQADLKNEIDGILTPAQSKRLMEIFIQMEGNKAVNNADVAKEVKLTDEQKAGIKKLQEKVQEAMRGLGEMMRNGELDRDGMMEKMKKNNEVLDSEIGKLLTDAQKAKLKEMGGKAFVKKDDGL
jgi:hypothetical protein